MVYIHSADLYTCIPTYILVMLAGLDKNNKV